jgi:hypothetical protein
VKAEQCLIKTFIELEERDDDGTAIVSRLIEQQQVIKKLVI